MNDTYQPPVNFPHSKYPQLPPLNYGQVEVNPQISHDKIGMNPEVVYQKLLLKSMIQMKEDSLNGVFGWTCRIWFSLMILFGVFLICTYMGNLLEIYRRYKEGDTRAVLNPILIVILLFCVWMPVQSVLTIANVGKKSVVRAKRLWKSMICFAIVYLILLIGVMGPKFDGFVMMLLLIFYGIPTAGNLIITLVMKKELESREELMSKLEALSAPNA